MRKPQVDNKYNLTMAKIRRLKIADRSKVCEPLFWRNDVIGAWCICGSSGDDMDRRFATNNEFWIGIYDLNAKAYAGKFRVHLSSCGGMCGYTFNKFYQQKDIDNEQDLEIQEKFLAKIYGKGQAMQMCRTVCFQVRLHDDRNRIYAGIFDLERGCSITSRQIFEEYMSVDMPDDILAKHRAFQNHAKEFMKNLGKFENKA